VASLALLSTGFALSTTLEQLGWMWLAADWLAPRWGALRAGTVTGAFWATLHVIPWLQAGRTVGWVAGQALFTVVFLCVILEVYLAQRSLIAAVALQASYDTSWICVASLGGTYQPLGMALGTTALLLAIRARSAGAPDARE
jgi:hypothetical protein